MYLSEAAWAWQQHEQNARKLTAWDEIGPFYKQDAPQTTQLQRRGDPGFTPPPALSCCYQFTVTAFAADGMPFVTTTRLLAPVSVLADTVK